MLRKQNIHLRTDDGNPRLIFKGTTVLYIPETQGKLLVIGNPSSEEASMVTNANEWYTRYGHLPFPAFTYMAEAPPKLAPVKNICEASMKGKSRKAPSPEQEHAIRYP